MIGIRLISLFVFSALIISGKTVSMAENSDKPLPIGLTDEEMTRLDQIGAGHMVTPPPSGPPRACAEWETATSVLIRWPLGIPVSLVAEFSEEVTVYTLVGTENYKNQAIASYTAGGVNMDNAEFIMARTNSIWTRDYGPWFVFDGDGIMGMADHIYNRPRPQDDSIPLVLGTEWSMDVYGTGLITTGGNHMTDGLGRSFSTELVYDENPGLTTDQVDSIMMAYLGTEYVVLDYIESGGIHHIDCWAKLLNPATILIKDVAPTDYRHSLLNARAEYLAGLESPWGRPYTIIRIFCPPGTAYTNSLILNDRVFVPTFGSDYDSTSLRLYEEAMPGYEVFGFSGSWYDDDAIHCRARGIFDKEMLYIDHIPLATTGESTEKYDIFARISAHSGLGLIEDSLLIHYSINGLPYQSLSLLPTVAADSFAGSIPSASGGDTIKYYLQAVDSSGRIQTHPVIGAPWAHEFYVNKAPDITGPASIRVAASSMFAYYPEFHDDDDFDLSISYRDCPEWLQTSNDSLIGTVPDSVLIASFTVDVSDQYNTTSQTITLGVEINSPPRFLGSDHLDAGLSVIFSYYPEYEDPDDSEIAITFENYPEWLTVVEDTLTGFTPDSALTVGFVVSISDPLQTVVRQMTLSVFLCGDANSDGSVNVGDAVQLINHIFKGGPSPFPREAGDANGDDLVNVGDAVYLINYVFKDGNPPDCGL